MKRLFTISVLSVLYVVGASGARADNLYTDPQTVFGTGSNENFNVATVGYVEAAAVPKYSYNDRNTVLVRDRYGEVTSVSAIDQDQVSGLADALAGKVDDTQIANAAATVASGNMDTMVPTVQRMANAIADAVSTGVGAVDLSSRVAVDQGSGNANKVMVTGADGIVTAATTIAQDKVENLTTDLSGKIGKTQVRTSTGRDMNGNEISDDLTEDQIVPTLQSVMNDFVGQDKVAPIDDTGALQGLAADIQSGYSLDAAQKDSFNAVVPSFGLVANSFVPSVPSEYVHTYGDSFAESGTGKPVAGSYVLTADVDDSGNVRSFAELARPRSTE